LDHRGSKHDYRRFWHWLLRRLEVGNAELTSSIQHGLQQWGISRLSRNLDENLD